MHKLEKLIESNKAIAENRKNIDQLTQNVNQLSQAAQVESIKVETSRILQHLFGENKSD